MSLIGGMFRDSSKPPLQPADFFESLPRAEEPEMSEDDMFARMERVREAVNKRGG